MQQLHEEKETESLLCVQKQDERRGREILGTSDGTGGGGGGGDTWRPTSATKIAGDDGVGGSPDGALPYLYANVLVQGSGSLAWRTFRQRL